jgi:plasmid maintenance system antidote protein VapI
MKTTKKAAIEKRGWKVGTAAEFLGLTRAESALIALKIALSRDLRDRRARRGLSQTELARQLKSSQSRVAKMEAAHPSVSVDLVLRSLFALGATPRDVGRLLAGTRSSAA